MSLQPTGKEDNLKMLKRLAALVSSSLYTHFYYTHLYIHRIFDWLCVNNYLVGVQCVG